jgi:hypothetical protein
MVVRESARQAILLGGHRTVHAWIVGTVEAMDGAVRRPRGAVRVGYSPRFGPTFTIRPGYAPIREAALVVLAGDGTVYALPERS